MQIQELLGKVQLDLHAKLICTNQCSTVCGTTFIRVKELIEVPGQSTAGSGFVSETQQVDEFLEDSRSTQKKPSRTHRTEQEILNDLSKFRRVRVVNPQVPAAMVVVENRCKWFKENEQGDSRDGYCTLYTSKVNFSKVSITFCLAREQKSVR